MAAGAATANAANFTCRSSVLRLEVPPGATLLEPLVGNNQNSPCASTVQNLPTLNVVGLATAGLLQTYTSATPTSSTAHTDLANVNVLLAPILSVAAANSTATASCSAAGTPVFAGSSEVVGLKVAGIPRVVLGTPNQVINLPLGLGQVVLNQQIVTGSEITRRAVYVNTLLLRTVVGESRAGVTGCAPPPPPQCSDGIDNDGDGETDFDPRNQPPFHPFGDQQCTSASDDDESA